MTRTVCFFRHAKSSWKHLNLRDIERPLKKRGKKDALLMGQLMKSKNLLPQEIISSPARRAQELAKILAYETDFNVLKVKSEESLYFTGLMAYMAAVRSASDKNKVIYIVGHNPDMTDLANKFAPYYVVNVPTSGVVCVEFDVESWSDCQYENGSSSLNTPHYIE